MLFLFADENTLEQNPCQAEVRAAQEREKVSDGRNLFLFVGPGAGDTAAGTRSPTDETGKFFRIGKIVPEKPGTRNESTFDMKW